MCLNHSGGQYCLSLAVSIFNDVIDLSCQEIAVKCLINEAFGNQNKSRIDS
jgi:hypothetical protein